MVDDEELLLSVLNSSPVIDGRATDQLDGEEGALLARRLGGSGSADEIGRLRLAREALHAVIRGDAHQTSAAIGRISDILTDTARIPRPTTAGIDWELHAPEADRLAVRAVLAWSSVSEALPGRLRACANTECNLFLVDHSRPGTAKWCSMATCGNRMKARAHASRARS